MKVKLYFYLFLIVMFSCNENIKENVQPLTLSDRSAFELDKLSFKEDVLKLYSEVSINNKLKEIFKKYDNFHSLEILEEEEILFKVFELKSLDILVPQNPYGFEFESKEIDSLAKFHHLYFNQLNSLTNLDRKLVAINASSKYKDENKRDSLLLSLNKFYGNPLMNINTSNEFDTSTYTWVTSNKIIEVTTSFGHSMEISTTGNSENYKYYLLDLLIVDHSQFKSLVRAHRHFYDDNFKPLPSYKPTLAKSEYLPQLIDIKSSFLKD